MARGSDAGDPERLFAANAVHHDGAQAEINSDLVDRRVFKLENRIDLLVGKLDERILLKQFSPAKLRIRLDYGDRYRGAFKVPAARERAITANDVAGTTESGRHVALDSWGARIG